MTIDEAIEHAEKVAEEHERHLKLYENMEEDRLLFKEEENECKKCAAEHRQLAEWLKDYKRLKEQEPIESVLDDIKAEIKRKTNSGQWSDAVIFGMQKAIAIIDKYKVESEDKRCI